MSVASGKRKKNISYLRGGRWDDSIPLRDRSSKASKDVEGKKN